MRRVELLSTPALAGALGRELVPEMARARGIDVAAVYLTTTALQERMAAGPAPDLLVGLDPALDGLAASGLVTATTKIPLATCGVGIALAPHVEVPAPTTLEELIDLLTSVSSVAYSRFGASGLHVARMLERLGIAQQVVPRATVIDEGFAAAAPLDGRAEVALQLAPELLMVDGTRLIGPLPAPVQKEVIISMLSPSPERPAAVEVAAALVTAQADAVYVRWGLTPLEHRAVGRQD